VTRTLHFSRAAQPIWAPACYARRRRLRRNHSTLKRGTTVWQIHPWLALGVAASTAATDAVYVMFSAAVASRRRVPAATWSSVWYLLSAFAVISYTRNWIYVCFAAVGSWIGAYLSMTLLRRPHRADELDRGEPKASA
jgi:hypothetical protein